MLVQLSICCILITSCHSSLSLQQYPQYQQQSPSLIFHPIQATLQTQHPSIPKLIFLTPWNPNGKSLTIKYAQKLAYISPCWYQLVVRDNKLVWENQHLFDQQYVRQIRQANGRIKILPRVYVKTFEVFRQIGASRQNYQDTVYLIMNMIRETNVDGIVWDSPYNTFIDDKNIMPLNNLIHELVNTLKNAFTKVQQTSKHPLQLFFNMANPSHKTLSPSLYKSLNIDSLLLQNYDTNLPFIECLKNSMSWIKQMQPKAPSITMLLPFFSYRNNQAISTDDVRKELEEDGVSFEGRERQVCKFVSYGKNTYHTPCFYYFQKAYQLIAKAKYSVGFWEAGNGLENYYLFM